MAAVGMGIVAHSEGRAVLVGCTIHQLARVGFEYALSHARRLPAPIRERLSIKRSSPYEIGFRSGLCQFLSADNEWQLQGRGLDLIVVDEAGEIDNVLYIHDQYLSPCLLDRAGSLIAIGTPRGRHTDYYQLCSRPEFVRFVGSSFDNPHISRDELERLSSELPEPLKLQELQGEFVDIPGGRSPTLRLTCWTLTMWIGQRLASTGVSGARQQRCWLCGSMMDVITQWMRYM
jgi:hypothetical protein